MAASNSGPDDSSEDFLLSRKEVARGLGVSVKTVERLDSDSSSSRRFPRPVRIKVPGRKRVILRWRKGDIDDYISNS